MATGQPNDKIWFEFDKPESEEHAKRMAEKANNMLKRLCAPEPAPQFFWSNHECKFCIQNSPGAGYLVLTDRGHWFNLDFFGRDIES